MPFDMFGTGNQTPSAPSVPSLDNSQPQSQSSTPTQPAPFDMFGSNQTKQPQGFSMFGQTGPSQQFDNTGTLKSVQLSHPDEALHTLWSGAASDIGGLVSGIGNIALTPVKVAMNLSDGKGAFDDTAVKGMAGLVSGAFQNLLGAGTTDEWEAMKHYYAQYLDHPLNMIANHPVNTLLDAASILDFGATSAGALARVGETGDLLEAASAARKAGEFDKAAELTKQYQAAFDASKSGQVSNKLSAIQHGINPFDIAGKAIGAVSDKIGLSDWITQTFSRAGNVGIDPQRATAFFQLADRLKVLKEVPQEFYTELEPYVKPLVDNPELQKIITDGIERPSLLENMPMAKAIADGIRSVQDKYITDPEVKLGLLKNLVDGGYLEHQYEDASVPNKYGAYYKSFAINAPNDKAATILRFDPINGEDGHLVGTAKYHNLTEKVLDEGQSVYEDASGKQYSARRPVISELQDAGLKPKGLFDALQHRTQTSFINQAKATTLGNIGEKFGTLQKPAEVADGFGHRYVLSDMIKTADKAGQYYYVPEDVEAAVKNFFQRTPEGQFTGGLKYLGDYFKKFMYANPASAGIHSVHLGFLGALADSNIADFFNAARDIKNSTPLFQRYQELFGNSHLGGLFENTPNSVEDLLKKAPETLGEKVIAKGKSLFNKLANPNSTENIASKALVKEDDFLRFTLFKQGLEKGMTEDQAIERANKFLGNHADLTPSERNIQAIFPFYHWMKTSLGASTNALTDQAGKLNIARAVGEGFQLKLSDAQAAGKVAIGSPDAKGNQNYLTLPIPMKDLRNILDDAPSFLFGRTNPFISVPASVFSNRQNIFNTDPNLQTLNQVHNPNLSNFDAESIYKELQFSAGKIVNPWAEIQRANSLGQLGLENIGVYQSHVNENTTQYFDRKDAIKAFQSLQKDYQKAIKNNNMIDATLLNKAMQMLRSQIGQ